MKIKMEGHSRKCTITMDYEAAERLWIIFEEINWHWDRGTSNDIDFDRKQENMIGKVRDLLDEYCNT